MVKYYNLTRMYRINRKGWDIRDQTFSSTGADSVTVTHVQMKLYIYICWSKSNWFLMTVFLTCMFDEMILMYTFILELNVAWNQVYTF